jgi:cobalt-zinc-cadmium efflux system membrane fusion protein
MKNNTSPQPQRGAKWKTPLWGWGLFLLLFSCQSAGKKDAHAGHDHEKEHAHAPNEVEFSEAQIMATGIEVGEFDQTHMGESIKATGKVDVPQEGRAEVHAPTEGFLRKGDILLGQYVEKGQALTYLEHQNFILLQENYLTVNQELAYLQKEYERQKELSNENVSAKKTFQRTEADLAIQQGKKASLEAQLRMLGIEPSQIAVGKLQTQLYVRAPLSGYIKKVNAVAGQFVSPQDVLYEIASPAHKHLELQVFEKDILKVKKGQTVIFYSPNAPKETYEGEIFLIGQNIDDANKSVNVHVHFDDSKAGKKLIEGMYLEAKILLETAQEATLPEEAIVREGEQNFVFVQSSKNHFKKMPIRIKNENEGKVALEIVGKLPENAKIVRKGTYYLNAQMNVGSEEGHAH